MTTKLVTDTRIPSSLHTPAQPLLHFENAAETSPQGEGAVPVTATTSQFVYIRVRRAVVLPAASKSTVTNLPSSTLQQSPDFIDGAFTDISRFAGTTVDWVIKVAHRILDLLGVSQVFTHTPSDWYTSDRAPS
jgi:hypothetical protein